MSDAIEAPNMESDLLEASNGDIFFITKSEDGKVGIEVLKLEDDEKQKKQKDDDG